MSVVNQTDCPAVMAESKDTTPQLLTSDDESKFRFHPPKTCLKANIHSRNPTSNSNAHSPTPRNPPPNLRISLSSSLRLPWTYLQTTLPSPFLHPRTSPLARPRRTLHVSRPKRLCDCYSERAWKFTELLATDLGEERNQSSGIQ